MEESNVKGYVSKVKAVPCTDTFVAKNTLLPTGNKTSASGSNTGSGSTTSGSGSLPKTGESAGWVISMIGLVLIVVAGTVYLLKRNGKAE